MLFEHGRVIPILAALGAAWGIPINCVVRLAVEVRQRSIVQILAAQPLALAVYDLVQRKFRQAVG